MQLIYKISERTETKDIVALVVSLATMTHFDLAKGNRQMALTLYQLEMMRR